VAYKAHTLLNEKAVRELRLFSLALWRSPIRVLVHGPTIQAPSTAPPIRRRGTKPRPSPAHPYALRPRGRNRKVHAKDKKILQTVLIQKLEVIAYHTQLYITCNNMWVIYDCQLNGRSFVKQAQTCAISGIVMSIGKQV